MYFIATGPPGAINGEIDWPALKGAIVGRLDVAAEFARLGVEFTRPKPNARDVRECRAVGREDAVPSAFVNVRTGVYHDSGGEGLSLHLFDFALRFGSFGRWLDVVHHYAVAAGVPFGPVRAGRGGKVREAQYLYRDAAGVVRYCVFRYRLPNGNKSFTQHPPDGRGGWKAGTGCMDGVEPLPYRLPDLLAADPDEPIWVCYSPDTEVLTKEGWTFFPDLDWQDDVAQFDPTTGSVSFACPIAIQKFAHDGPMVHVKADWCDLLVTPDHRMLVKYERCNPKVVPASSVVRGMHLPVAGRLDNPDPDLDRGDSPSPSLAQARLLAAFAADATLCRGFLITWNLKKERKVERLRRLLLALEITWTEKSFPSTPDWTVLSIDRRESPWLCEFMPDKQWHWACIMWTPEARAAAIDELSYWDGDSLSETSARFFTAKREEADTVSAMAALSGWGSTIRLDNRPSRPDQAVQYIVNLSSRDWRALGHAPEQAAPVGEVWCCTVPDGFIVVRRNGKVTIAGNCEGEADADRLAARGLVATTNHQGAQSTDRTWPFFLDHFVGRDVRILPDNDPGGRTHARKVAGHLHGIARSVKVVDLPGLPPKGDVSDWLDLGHDLEELGRLACTTLAFDPAEPVEESTEPDPDRDATVADLRAVQSDEAWVWPLWIPQAALTLVAAEAGTGKTRFCFDLHRRLFHGLAWPDGTPPTLPPGSRTLWVVADNQWQEMCDVAAAFGIPDDLVVVNAPASDPYGGTSLQTADELADFEARIDRVRPALVVIDTITNTGDFKAQDSSDAKRQYKPLQEIAARLRVPILCVTHLNVGGKVLGRRAVEKVRVVIQMEYPDPDDQPHRRKLWVSKSKAIRPPALGVTMGDAGNEYDTDPPSVPGTQRFGEATTGPLPVKTTECMAWLSARLALGRERVRTIRQAAELAGHSARTLYTARDRLEIVEEEVDGYKFWSPRPAGAHPP